MTEKKFRVWEPLRNKFLYFDLPNCPIFRTDLLCSYKYSVQQFTGLKDKTGKEIYEGDIVKTNYDDIKEVQYDARNGHYRLESKDTGYGILSGEEMEIIGNIFENPELINV